MKRYLQNVIDMGTNVSVFMKKNNTLWLNVPSIVDTVALVDGDLTTLAGVDVKAAAPVIGAAADKSVSKFDLENQTLLVANQIAALAVANNDHTLEGQADLSLTDLDRMKEADLVATATRIGNLALANLPALAAYNLTQADLTTLSNMAAKFQGAQTAPRQAVVDRKKEIEQLPPVASHLLSILRRRLDRQMFTFKQPQPETYAGYLASRVIVDRGNPAKKKITTPAKPTP